MKKVLFILLASVLVLAACGNKEESRLEDNKEETKTSEKEKNKDDKKDEEKESKPDDNSNEDVATQDDNTEQQTKEDTSQSQENKKVDVSNITDRSVLESVIYGNYSEMEKINAYNSAVANGVIPQGNVMEGPASAAYESSLKVESGEDESVYEKNNKGTDAQAADEMEEFYQEERVKEQEAEKAQEAKEAKLQEEYFGLSDKMYGDEEYSDEEMEAMEKRQDEILDEVEPIN
ncbi:hypothetical protein QI116_01575 [Staphylococcus saprophyticus]|uniref:hypothetical protein n=1 Tax=Staphylococcus saprophyticus TaxID=29385 RepID=UPI00099087AD|nr:hypothetical protein [Staphylococcus saprophyticus]MDW3865206.1 hypothetical protein [Staphylococcus saprophyticus]MDW3939411.1 hypothetical protein [Staphylococcus saprophyticus]MDW3977193.1 hypothetical protein [Staphylococcus saprophyticus]MDW4124409.1 hypothetical protein [Staphylococcus saprophyticus]MDW4185044.1 hypothetical protein [Staphylococcus saprophyticus]